LDPPKKIWAGYATARTTYILENIITAADVRLPIKTLMVGKTAMKYDTK